jgi:ribosomal protein S18 acetylase RimI-like enzyme
MTSSALIPPIVLQRTTVSRMMSALNAPVRVWTVDASSLEALRPRLCEILIACVHDGASIGFLEPLEPADADAFWHRIGRAVADGRCILFVAAQADGTVVGTVQLDVDTLPNQPHRATVSKLLVHPGARRRGVGEALMAGLEQEAAAAGRWLLTLDTATDAAARLYERLGWALAGDIPDYALNPDGTLTATSFYWKRLARPPAGAELR